MDTDRDWDWDKVGMVWELDRYTVEDNTGIGEPGYRIAG